MLSDYQFQLSTLSPGDIKFDNHKFDAIQLARLTSLSLPDFSNRILSCCTDLTFACTDDGKLKLTQTQTFTRTGKSLPTIRFCRQRGCPICSWRRSLSWQARAISCIPKLLRKYSDHRFLFATFTLKNPPLTELRFAVSRMKRAFSAMSRRCTLGSKGFRGNKRWVSEGYIRSLEVTRGSVPGCCHPHFHCLLLMPPQYFSKEYDYYMASHEWATMWAYYLRLDYQPLVDVRVVKDPIRAIPEIFKYGAKPVDLLSDEQFCLAYLSQMKGVHLTEAAGAFSECLKFEDDNDDENLINVIGDSRSSGGNLIHFRWSKDQAKSLDGGDLYSYKIVS